jgi:hypothetical protein
VRWGLPPHPACEYRDANMLGHEIARGNDAPDLLSNGRPFTGRGQPIYSKR